jgi:hypothetical protein
MLVRLAKDKGLKGFTADVLASNKGMMKVFEKSGLSFKTQLESGAFHLTISFDEDGSKPAITPEYSN